MVIFSTTDYVSTSDGLSASARMRRIGCELAEWWKKQNLYLCPFDGYGGIIAGGGFVGGLGYRYLVWVDAGGPRLAGSSVECNCASSLC